LKDCWTFSGRDGDATVVVVIAVIGLGMMADGTGEKNERQMQLRNTKGIISNCDEDDTVTVISHCLRF
jgi:hypothetical protein